ncbi:hypothetical protein [Pseudonocardia sp. H11422]|nr:hypothetical protein [Pseudonocardia sp. H11422]
MSTVRGDAAMRRAGLPGVAPAGADRAGIALRWVRHPISPIDPAALCRVS